MTGLKSETSVFAHKESRWSEVKDLCFSHTSNLVNQVSKGTLCLTRWMICVILLFTWLGKISLVLVWLARLLQLILGRSSFAYLCWRPSTKLWWEAPAFSYNLIKISHQRKLTYWYSCKTACDTSCTMPSWQVFGQILIHFSARNCGAPLVQWVQEVVALLNLIYSRGNR